MPTQVQLRRGNSAQVAAFTGANGELIIDYETHQVVVQDGVTPGGFATPNSQIVADAYTNAVNFASNATNISTGTLSSARLPVSGVSAGTYGNSSQIPVLTVDATGRLTFATTNAVAGVSSFTYTAANNTLALSTSDGNTYRTTISAVNALSVTGQLQVSNDVSITGNLLVTGTTTFINSTALDIKDINITLAKGSSAAAADGAGITIDGANIGLYYDLASNTWASNVGITPSTNATLNLGTSTKYWANVYANNILAVNLSGNGASVTSVNAAFLGGNSVSDLRSYSESQGSTAYSNATTFASNATNITNGTLNASRLPVSGVASGTYGNSSQIPVITVDSTGRITSATVNAVAGVTALSYASSNNTISLSTGDGSVFNATISSVNSLSVSNVLTVSNGLVVTSNLSANNLYLSKNAVIDGNLTVYGTTLTVSAANFTTSDNLLYLNEAAVATVTNASGNGTHILYTANNNYYAGGVASVTGISPSGFNTSGYVPVTFANSTTFAVANTFTGSYSSGGSASFKAGINVDLGFAGGYDDGTYRHAGFFRDATDGLWKVFDGYVPEPDAAVNIDTTDATFKFADFKANTVYLGNSSVNWLVSNSAGIYHTGTLNVASITTTSLSGNLTGNVSATTIGATANVTVGSNLTINTGALFVGNSTVNATVNSSVLTINGGTITANNPVLNLTQTWNSLTPIFTGMQLNVTDTQSNSSSVLMDLQVGGVSRTKISKLGVITANSVILPDPITLNQNMLSVGNRVIVSGLYGVPTIGQMSSSRIAWSGGTTVNYDSAFDLFLTRKAAANLGLGDLDGVGASASVSASDTTDLITWNGHGLMTGSTVYFTNTGGSLPGGINSGTIYYVNVQSNNTFKLYTTYDGAMAGGATALVDITSVGSGTTTAKAARTQQSLSVQSFTGTDIPGAPLVFNSSQGTGSAAGGSIIFRIAPATTSGTTQNGLTTALAIRSDNTIQLNKQSVFATGRSSPTIGFDAAGGTGGVGIWCNSRSYIEVVTDGTGVAAFATGGAFAYLSLPSNGIFGFASGTVDGAPDTRLNRDGAGILAQRNSTSAQTFRVYSTYDGTNNAYGFMEAGVTTNVLAIGSRKLGSPTALTKMSFEVDGTRRLDYNVTKASTWTFSADAVELTGNLVVKAIVANGVVGTANQILTSNGTSTYWTTISSTGSVSEYYVASGSQSNFTLTSSTISQNNSVVSLDGIVQIPGVNYTISGSTLSFTDPPIASTLVEAKTLVAANNSLLVATSTPSYVGYAISGGGSAISSGVAGVGVVVPFNCTISSVTAYADQVGSISVDVWKSNYANFPPTVANSITGGNPITITGATKSQDSTLTGWSRVVNADDVLYFNVISASTVQNVMIALKVTKS